jgi:hypothetical protein
MERVENVATPLAAARVVVPESVPEPGLVPIAMVTDALEAVTTLPEESSMVTTTGGEIVDPWVAFEGCTVKTSCVATFEMLKLVPIALVTPELAAVNVTPVA